MKNQRNGKVLLKKCTIFGLVISETNIKVKSILFQIIIFYVDSGLNVKTEILLFKENPVVYCKCLLASGLYVFLYIFIYLSIYPFYSDENNIRKHLWEIFELRIYTLIYWCIPLLPLVSQKWFCEDTVSYRKLKYIF